jgi:predicted TIM-barrel fold metal-dependent hydrolase
MNAPTGSERTRRRIDCDVHCAVPSVDALFPYLPEAWVDHLRASVYGAPGGVSITYPRWARMVATPGADLTLERIQDDVLSQNSLAVLQCYYGVESVQHPYLAASLATAVNDWLRTEWLDHDDRLRASAVITPQHCDAAVAEIERIAGDPRFVQVMLPVRSWEPYGHPRYAPIWEAASRNGLAVGLTFGGGSGSPPSATGWVDNYFEEYILAAQQFQTHLMNMVMQGTFTRHEDLHVVLMESGWTWLPDLLWIMDANWKEFRRDAPWVTERPSTYIRRQVSVVSQPVDAPSDPARLARVIEQLGSDNMLVYGSDYPHRYPHGNDLVMASLTPTQIEQVEWGNAHRAMSRLSRTAAGPVPVG